MGIELRKIMRVFPFSEAKLIAGKDGIDRQVVSANIQEVPEVERWLKGGEILLTSGYAIRDAGSGAALIRVLHEKRAASIAIETG